MNNYMVELRNVSKCYKSTHLVKNIDLHVERGKITALLGENGVGKSTLIRLILGLIHPTEGNIIRDGEESLSTGFLRNKVGAMIEIPKFYDNLTAEENLRIFYALRGLSDKNRIAEVLKLMKLDQQQKKTVGHFSVGMRQRLGIAEAILHKPKFLILDEPMNGLDPSGMEEIRSYILELVAKEGVTVLMSTHILDEVEGFAEYIAILHKGSLLEEKNIKDIVSQKGNCFLFQTDNDELSIALIGDNFPDVEIISENQMFSINADLTRVNEVGSFLLSKGVKISSMTEKFTSLKDYYFTKMEEKTHDKNLG